MAIEIFQPDSVLLISAVGLDLLIGDPVYRAHPVRLMGGTLTWFEDRLRAAGADGYGGGICLFVLLAGFWTGCLSLLLLLLNHWLPVAALFVHLFLVYSLIALHDLLRHAWAVEKAACRNDLDGARAAIARLVGRDTDRMDFEACRRAAIESVSENLTDGFISLIFWYALGGLQALVLFKVVSTMDSMVGYRTERYLKFGWCGARLDDLMNWVPARITWLLIAVCSIFVPRCSMTKAVRIGWKHHAIVPGPNSGWSEAATAGSLRRRLIGPIWAGGKLVTEAWIGDPGDPPAGDCADLLRALILMTVTGLVFTAGMGFFIFITG